MRRSEFAVTADHHQFLIYSQNDLEGDEVIPEGVGDGLVVAGKVALKIFTGTTYGPVSVQVELHNREPGLPAAEWTEVSEVSFRLHQGPLEVGTLMGGMIPDSPDLAVEGPGSYRIRVAAQARDKARNGADAESGDQRERYLIAIWEAPEAPPETLRKSDLTGRSFRGEIPVAKLDEAIDRSARNAFYELMGLLQSGVGTTVSSKGQIELWTATRAQPEIVACVLGNSWFWPGWLGISGSVENHDDWRTNLAPYGLYLVGEAIFDVSSVTTSWQYLRMTPPSEDDPFPRFEPMLSAPATVRITWAGGADGTVVDLKHQELPEPLESSVADLWRYYFARLSAYCELDMFSHHPWL
ncbi:conserved hypothetical protein [Frankia sp. Hr75.2]|nr:conserved hypothetical protein [Frankia sp. Hr75.2]